MENKKKIWKMLKFKQTKNKSNKKKIKTRIRIKILKIMNKVVNMSSTFPLASFRDRPYIT